MGIIIALLIFGLIVTVHEFGHFICAKLSGIDVLEFSIGMGPKLLQKKWGDTVYSLRALPLGGYCAMEGEDSSTGGEHGFREAKLWKRMIVLAAGAFMNFVLGFVLLIIMSSMFDVIPTTQIKGFDGIINDDQSITYYSHSYMTGLRHEDIIRKIDGTSVYSILDLNYIFATTKLDKHEVVVEREGEKVTLEDIEFYDEADGETMDFGVVTLDKNPVTVTKSAGKLFLSMGHIVELSLKQMLQGKVEKEQVSGPIGVVTAINEATEESEDAVDTVFNLVYMAALITINVGIFNLLPVPGLDGGRLLFCFIELIRRKPVKPEHEGYVHLAGMALLFGLMIIVTFNDIMRLIQQ
ncbi:MAG: site-2 protease family protein [Ruminococcus sp.]|nr:site-2 protease family protein [Ruminococcus sp.]